MWAGFSSTFRIYVELCPGCILKFQKYYIATKRPEERAKHPRIVGSVEKLDRRRKPEIRGGSSHHLPTSRVQESDVPNQMWVDFRLWFGLIFPLISLGLLSFAFDLPRNSMNPLLL